MAATKVRRSSHHSSEFKICFLCSNETSDHEESSQSKFSSEEECSFVLSHILEVPFLESYLERVNSLKSESGFGESPISYCTRCITRITRVRDVLEQLEKLEKVLIHEKHDIEMEFRRNCGEFLDRGFTPHDDEQVSHLDEIKNDILTDLRSSAILTMLERLQTKRIGRRSKPRKSMRVIRDAKVPKTSPKPSTMHQVPVSNDLRRSTRPRTKPLSGGKTSRNNDNAGDSWSSKFTHVSHPAFQYEESFGYDGKRDCTEPVVLNFGHPNRNDLHDAEVKYSGSTPSTLPNCSSDDMETVVNFKEETDEDVPMMMVETTFREDDNSLEQLNFSEEPVSSEIVNEVAAATTNNHAFFPDNIKTLTDYSSEPNSVPSPKQNLFLTSGPSSDPEVVVWTTSRSPLPQSSKQKDSSNSGFTRLSKSEFGEHHPGPVTIRKKSISGTRRICNWGNMSYADLITQAIQSAPDQRMTLGQIYDWIVKNAPFFKNKEHSNSSTGWKNTVRHNLSLHNNRFTRCKERDAGKSSWWMVLLEP